MKFPSGFAPPSQETIDRVMNPDTFVVAWWNSIPADNSGKRSVSYLTSQTRWCGGEIGDIELWNILRSNAKQFPTEAEAEAARAALKLTYLRSSLSTAVYPNCEAHVRTGGLPGKELT